MSGVSGVRHVVSDRGAPPSYPTGNTTMERVTLRIPKQQIDEVEQLVDSGEFPNRSEAIRSAVREMINEQYDGHGEQAGKHNWAKV